MPRDDSDSPELQGLKSGVARGASEAIEGITEDVASMIGAVTMSSAAAGRACDDAGYVDKLGLAMVVGAAIEGWCER